MANGVTEDRQVLGDQEVIYNWKTVFFFLKLFQMDRKRKGDSSNQLFCDFREFPYERF